jgi:hypothetical protein
LFVAHFRLVPDRISSLCPLGLLRIDKASRLQAAILLKAIISALPPETEAQATRSAQICFSGLQLCYFELSFAM